MFKIISSKIVFYLTKSVIGNEMQLLWRKAEEIQMTYRNPHYRCKVELLGV